ncbi:MAG: hypothetical protein IBX45_11800 [Campylobacterales bacterium]|nr:hypothetical protein [Campylobacterales bacterium]
MTKVILLFWVVMVGFLSLLWFGMGFFATGEVLDFGKMALIEVSAPMLKLFLFFTVLLFWAKWKIAN